MSSTSSSSPSPSTSPSSTSLTSTFFVPLTSAETHAVSDYARSLLDLSPAALTTLHETDYALYSIATTAAHQQPRWHALELNATMSSDTVRVYRCARCLHTYSFRAEDARPRVFSAWVVTLGQCNTTHALADASKQRVTRGRAHRALLEQAKAEGDVNEMWVIRRRSAEAEAAAAAAKTPLAPLKSARGKKKPNPPPPQATAVRSASPEY
jgi:hypothetical protein